MVCSVLSCDIYYEEICIGRPVLKIQVLKCALTPPLHQQAKRLQNELKEMTL